MFPLAIWFAIFATGTSAGIGLGAGIEAKELFNEAQDIANKAKRRLEDAIEKAKDKEIAIKDRLDTFRNLLIDIENSTFSKIKSLINYASSNQDIQKEVTQLAKRLQSNYYPILNARYEFVDVIFSLAKGVSLSAVTPVLLTQIAIMFGTASTGTAISALSGVAAKNAIMAWLGGGALSAGGWGIAGGALVCNAITFGMGMLITGIALNIKAEKAMTEAKKYRAQVELEVAKINNSIKYADVLDRKVILVHNSINEINKSMTHLLNQSFSNSSRQEAARILKIITLASVLKRILSVNMHDKNLQEIEMMLNERISETQDIIASIN